MNTGRPLSFTSTEAQGTRLQTRTLSNTRTYRQNQRLKNQVSYHRNHPRWYSSTRRLLFLVAPKHNPNSQGSRDLPITPARRPWTCPSRTCLRLNRACCAHANSCSRSRLRWSTPCVRAEASPGAWGNLEEWSGSCLRRSQTQKRTSTNGTFFMLRNMDMIGLPRTFNPRWRALQRGNHGKNRLSAFFSSIASGCTDTVFVLLVTHELSAASQDGHFTNPNINARSRFVHRTRSSMPCS